MAVAARGWHGFRVFLEMIKIEHSVFALPFAMLGMIWASRSVSGSLWPGGWKFGWIVVAMVSARSAAMTYNRIADCAIDTENPRTAKRAIPAGILTLRTANLYFFTSIALFVLASAMLNPLALALSPLALLVTLGYSLTKRFTWLCHWVLGLGLGIAPAASWIAVTGKLDPNILWLTATVTLWTAGFDLIYALQDEAFDREKGLHSLPERIGAVRALGVSRLCHILAIASLVLAGVAFGASAWFWVGVVLAAGLLIYEQSLVRPNDLSRVNMAFFTLNGFVSIGVFLFAWADAIFSGRGTL